jgi:hypothetical protein
MSGGGSFTRAGMAAARRRELLCAAATIAVALAGFVVTYWFDEVPAALTQGLGAVEFPRLVCAVLLAFGVLMALRRPEPQAEASLPLSPCFWATFAAVALFLPVVSLIGMLPSILLFLVGVGWIWGERRHGLLLGSSAGFTAALWLVFVRVFGMTMPDNLLTASLH